jgi:hypothetical protein
VPVHSRGRGCYQWGQHGKVYCGPGARQKAERQGRAAHARGYGLREPSSDWEDALVRGDARYVPAGVAPQMPGVVARARAAGARPPLEYVGAGMTGVVLCAGDVAYKVARDTRPIDHQFFEEEADWLAAASQVPAVAPHVAHLHDFDPESLVIVRDCVRADPEQSAWRYGEGKLHDLHRQIERDMIPYGWTAPEFKPDSYVLTTRGPVLVDASMPSRVGNELAQYVEAVVADERPLWTTRPEDLAFAVRMEAGRTLTQEESDRLEAMIARRWSARAGEVRERRLREVREPNLSYLLGPMGTIRAIGHEDGPEPPTNGIARYRSEHGSYRYVYYVRGEPVSAIQVMARDKKHGRVANVWTAPHARRNGYATKLIQQARKDFKTVEHSDALSADAVAWIDRVGEARTVLAENSDWILVAPLAQAQILGGAYLASSDGRFVIFARRYRVGDKGRREYRIEFQTVEYLGGDSRRGGENRTLYEGQNLAVLQGRARRSPRTRHAAARCAFQRPDRWRLSSRLSDPRALRDAGPDRGSWPKRASRARPASARALRTGSWASESQQPFRGIVLPDCCRTDVPESHALRLVPGLLHDTRQGLPLDRCGRRETRSERVTRHEIGVEAGTLRQALDDLRGGPI